MLGEVQAPLPCVEELCPVQRQALGGTDTSLYRDHGRRHASQIPSKGQIQSKELLPKVRGRGDCRLDRLSPHKRVPRICYRAGDEPNLETSVAPSGPEAFPLKLGPDFECSRPHRSALLDCRSCHCAGVSSPTGLVQATST